MKHIALFLIAFFSAALPAIAAPKHIPTWAFDQRFAQGENASEDDVRHLVTYALSGLGNDKAQRDCAGSGTCFSVFYFDPSFVYDSAACPFSGDREVIAAAREDWFVHLPGTADKANRIHGSYTQNCKGTSVTVPVYALDQSNPAVAAYFKDYLQRNADNWDYYEMDDTSLSMVNQFYGPGGGFCKGLGIGNGYCNRTEEIADERGLYGAHTTFASRLRHRNGTPMRFFFNGISFDTPASGIDLLRQSQFVGALCENCVISAGSLRPAMYAKTLDAMARVNAIDGASFVELTTGSSPSGSDDQIAQRLVTTAVAWLGFSPARTIVWPNLETNTHNLAVWPEDAIYPTTPLESMHSGAHDLEVAPSVWRREFARCYRDGKLVGACGAVLNGSPAPLAIQRTWFHLPFTHVIELHGGDALSGGSLGFTGSLRSVTLAPGQAALVIP